MVGQVRDKFGNQVWFVCGAVIFQRFEREVFCADIEHHLSGYGERLAVNEPQQLIVHINDFRHFGDGVAHRVEVCKRISNPATKGCEGGVWRAPHLIRSVRVAAHEQPSAVELVVHIGYNAPNVHLMHEKCI